jgi:hypothetical protein
VARDFGWAAALGALTAALGFGAYSLHLSGGVQLFVRFVIPTLLLFWFWRRPIRFGLGVLALLVASQFFVEASVQVLHTERSFFGLHRVTLEPLHKTPQFHVLFHGSTRHGRQHLDPAQRRTPLTYYFPSGPLGQLFSSMQGARAPQTVGSVGLGSGSVACYRQPGQRWTFYEIDPSVVRIARDRRYFTYLSDCAPEASIVLGDARLSLGRTTERYDLLILDAYSSDSIPIHLITREALQLYLGRLQPHGLLAFHISNRHLDLQPVLRALAQDAGLYLRVNVDEASEAERQQGKEPSAWAIMARSDADAGPLAHDPRWRPAHARPGMAVWTDAYSSLLQVLRRDE